MTIRTESVTQISSAEQGSSPGRSRSPRRLLLLALGLAATVAAGTVLPAGSATAAPVLLSQGKAASASSVENTDYTPAAGAFDGNPGTRWSSKWTDDQWLQVDLGATATVERIELDWEGAAFARSYELQISANGTTGWSTLSATETGAGGKETVTVNGTGRYVRMQGVQRASGYGYALWEMRVFGSLTTGPTNPPVEPPTGPVDSGYPNQPGPFTQPSVVKVTGGNGNWQLRVDDKPYTVKGFTWGPSANESEKYLPALTATGANTIRTWGTGAETVQLLDKAAAAGVRVINGFWLYPGGGPGSGGCVEYTTNTKYKSDTQAEILKWVEQYKSHPAVLMWNVGNESLLGLQNCYSGDKLEAERVAYASYVNDVTKAIHQIDANHPVTSTDAWTGSWPYYKNYSPDLDLLAVNSYGDVCSIRQTWIDGGYDKPYIVTEGGAAGEWEVTDDANGVPDEPTDLEKAAALVDSWKCIIEHKNVGLGATFFHFGLEGDFGGVWFNVIPGGNKRLGYYSIAEAWGKTGFTNTPPRITSMAIPASGSVVGGTAVDIDISVTDPDGDPLKYVTFVNSNYVNGSGGMQYVEHTRVDGDTIRITAPKTLGVWKAYVFVEDGKGNVGVEGRSFRVVAPTISGTNVALGKTATSSPFQTWGDNYSPGQAFDGNSATRWSSEWGATAFLQVDLGAPTSFDRMQLVWETAFAKSYTVSTSNDGVTWTPVKSVTGGTGWAEELSVSATARYVRIDMTERALEFGYSLYEVGIYRTT